MTTRNSTYLERKAGTLGQALQFFLGAGPDQGREARLITFLDQIDFWDWEVEELIFTFNNFAERAAAFNTLAPGSRAAEHGVLVKANKAVDLAWDRRFSATRERHYGGHPGPLTGREVTAPREALEDTLRVWHTLLGTAEKTVMATPATVAAAVRAGALAYRPNLDRYRKTAPPAEETR